MQVFRECLIPYHFRKKIIVVNPTFLTQGFWINLQDQVCVCSHGVSGLKSNQKRVGYFYTICATSGAIGISCQSGSDRSLQDSQLGKTFDDFPLPAGYITPSSTLKARQQEEKLPY